MVSGRSTAPVRWICCKSVLPGGRAKRRGAEVIAWAVEFLDRPRRDTDSEQQSRDMAVAA